jgi:hypothetical protein
MHPGRQMNGINKNRSLLFTGEGSSLLMTIKPTALKTLQRQLLAHLLLALFLTPGLIQVFHHHEHESIHVHSIGQGSLLSKYEHCAICSFEFVSFLKSEPVFISQGDVERHALQSGLCEAPVLSDVLVLSDRAPPLS